MSAEGERPLALRHNHNHKAELFLGTFPPKDPCIMRRPPRILENKTQLNGNTIEQLWGKTTTIESTARWRRVPHCGDESTVEAIQALAGFLSGITEKAKKQEAECPLPNPQTTIHLNGDEKPTGKLIAKIVTTAKEISPATPVATIEERA